MKTHSRYKTARRWLIFWTLFIGIGAVGGACGMFADPSGKAMGMDSMLPYFQKLPFADIVFQNLIFSGFALLIVNGLSNIMAAYFLFKKKKAGIILGTTFGITLMLWICIQFYAFPMNFMSTIYFFFGLAQALTGYAAYVFYRQENFLVHIEDYTNIGTNKKELVVYFSRMGYVKKAAYEKANETGANIYEVKSTEMTEGTKGFWWCGRFGMHNWEMPIEKVKIDLGKYDKVTICTPIWVFNLSAPMRSFCKQVSGGIKEANYILVHHQKSDYPNAVQEMNSLLNVQVHTYTSICSRKGKVLYKKETMVK